MRELAVQSANSTNSQSDLDSIQAEITQRLNEIDRVSGQTQFNGVKVLAQDNTLTIQVGANDGETIDIDLKQINSQTLGLDSLNVQKKYDVKSEAVKSGGGQPSILLVLMIQLLKRVLVVQQTVLLQLRMVKSSSMQLIINILLK
ncbi:flagellin [Salmonella enterica subsp. enterica]|uniref:Flagellin n=1 Tax=Salmonella enterica I TaxID=59201 RepID=A0A379VNA6_SALET|nr:flagellin [Salmonella enterica subsp. enterica]